MIRQPLTQRPIFWDTLIALLCIALILLMIVSAMSLSSQPVSVLGIMAGYAGLVIILYGSFLEPKRIKLNTKSIHIDAPHLRIAVIADLHVGPYKRSSYLERVVKDANALEPDLIFLVGDFLFDHTSDIAHLDPLRDLQAAHGIFAVLGNHDSGHHLLHGKHYQTLDRSDEVASFLEERGITMLRNSSKRLMIDDIAFRVAGIDDIWMPSFDLDAAFDGADEHEPVILLAHNPDVISDTRSHKASLIVSGHTHGGQIRLPFIGSIYPIPTLLGRAYDQGIFSINDRTMLAITHGIGETQTRARLFCPPEILLLSLFPRGKESSES